MIFNHETGTFYYGDCLELMKQLPDNSVDMILCDLPYGTTQNKWDSVIPFEPLWEQYWRIAKSNAAVVLTAQPPFDKVLGCSQLKYLKYEWIWEKSHPTGHLNANKMPMKAHENVLVFYKNLPIYNAQKSVKDKCKIRPDKRVATSSCNYGKFNPNAERTDRPDVKFPSSIVKFNNSTVGGDKGKHPTQKPVSLFEYLIKTYTNEGATVLDNCAGSGTTAIAAMRTGRRWVCMEKELGYYLGAVGRVLNEQ